MIELSITKKDGDILFSSEVVKIIDKINELVRYYNKIQESNSGGHGGDSSETVISLDHIENIDVSYSESPLDKNYLTDDEMKPETVWMTIYYIDNENLTKSVNLSGLISDLLNSSSNFYQTVKKYLAGSFYLGKCDMNYVINNNNNSIGTYLYPFAKRSLTSTLRPCKYREYEEWLLIDTGGINYIDNIPTLYEMYKRYSSEIIYTCDLRYSSKDPDDFDLIAIDNGHYGRPLGNGESEGGNNYHYHKGVINFSRINYGVYCKELLRNHPLFSITASNNNTTYSYYLSEDWNYYRPVLVLTDHILTNMFFIIKASEFTNSRYGGTWDNFVNNFNTCIRNYIDDAKETTINFNNFGKYYHNDPHETDLDNKRAYAITKVNEGVMFYGDNEVENETNESNLESFQKTKYDLFIRRYYRESDNNQFWRGANYTYNMYKRGLIDIKFEEGDILVFLTKDYTCNSGYNHMFHCMPGTSTGLTAGLKYLNPEAHLWISGGSSDTEKFASYLGTSEYFISLKNINSSGQVISGKEVYANIGYEDIVSVPNTNYTYKRYGGRDYFCWAFKSHINGCLMDCGTGPASGNPS